ncbi:MAG: 4Fe-4S dicluster domain-containing protein [Roseburia sp.]|nr:4Fe-4S dicluster domain-containing protein [Roseburia sp.]
MSEKKIPDLSSDKSSCCGCAACYSVCPVGAITMQPDEKGFPYPVIAEALCIGCQKCIGVCAFKKDNKNLSL